MGKNTPYGRRTPDCSPQQIKRYDSDIRHERDSKNELGEFARTPGAFEILAAVEERGQIQEDSEDVLLDKGGAQESPGIEEKARGHESQIGHENRACFNRGISRSADLAPSSDVVEEGQGEERDETEAGDGGDIDTEGHFK